MVFFIIEFCVGCVFFFICQAKWTAIFWGEGEVSKPNYVPKGGMGMEWEEPTAQNILICGETL